MSCHIAITGKGGVGKTTIAALIVSRLLARKCSPVLAVDADPNSCLDAALGVTVKKTIGGVREQAREQIAGGGDAGISKTEMLQLRISESLVEADGFDVIAMGRPEGPGCYCYANNVLKAAIETIASQYPYVVLDNEAGLENLSRRIMTKMDVLIMVAEPSVRGLETVRRLHCLALEMGISFRRLAIIINRLRRDAVPQAAEQLRKDTGADFIVGLPEDREILDLCEAGGSVFKLGAANPVIRLVDNFLLESGITRRS
jgi:CO dehydrogenase maturation factor